MIAPRGRKFRLTLISGTGVFFVFGVLLFVNLLGLQFRRYPTDEVEYHAASPLRSLKVT